MPHTSLITEGENPRRAEGAEKSATLNSGNQTPAASAPRAKASVGGDLSAPAGLAEAWQEINKLRARIAALEKKERTLGTSWAQVAANRNSEALKPRTHKKTEIIVTPDPMEDGIRRRGQDALQAAKKQIGEAVESARRLPDGRTVLRLAAGQEDSLLKNNDWMKVVFGRKSRITKGGYMVLIKGMSEAEMAAVSDREIERQYGALQISRKTNQAGYGTILCRIPDAQVARTMTTDGAKLGQMLYRCEPFLNRNHTKQCFNCYGWGHIGSHCRNAPRCNECGRAFHEGACDRVQCVNCKGKHPARAKSLCPVAHEATQEAKASFSKRPRHFPAQKIAQEKQKQATANERTKTKPTEPPKANKKNPTEAEGTPDTTPSPTTQPQLQTEAPATQDTNTEGTDPAPEEGAGQPEEEDSTGVVTRSRARPKKKTVVVKDKDGAQVLAATGAIRKKVTTNSRTAEAENNKRKRLLTSAGDL